MFLLSLISIRTLEPFLPWVGSKLSTWAGLRLNLVPVFAPTPGDGFTGITLNLTLQKQSPLSCCLGLGVPGQWGPRVLWRKVLSHFT